MIDRRAAVVLAAVALAGLVVSGCNDDRYLPRNSRHYVSLSSETIGLMSTKGLTKHDPILLRAYKKESELEVWKMGRSGEYVLLKTYPMCRWSGQLGPKVREGDRQVPEGFYAISPSQMNPNSSFYLSFNIGYPNTYDRAFGRSGAHIMVHGACSSSGCFSMTDEQIADIYALTREAFSGGQKAVQMQSLPFRMTAQNLAKFRADKHMPFWKNLKEGSDHFEVTKREPQVNVCDRRYVFNAADGCARTDAPAEIAQAVASKRRADDVQIAELVSHGTRAVRRIYKDGDQHPVFASAVSPKTSADSGEAAPARTVTSSGIKNVSRAEALHDGVSEVPVDSKGDHSLLASAKLPEPRPAQADAKSEAAKTEAAKTEPAKAETTVAEAAKSEPAKAALTASAPAAKAAAPAAAVLPASAAAMAAQEPAKTDAPFYRRVFGLGAGKTDEPLKINEPAQPTPAKVPLPPKRQAGSAKLDKQAVAPAAGRDSHSQAQ